VRIEDLLSPEQVATLSDDQVRAIVARARELQRRAQEEGPQSKDELWWWIKENVGIELTRVAVCEGHTSPLDFLWDIFSRNTTSALLVANRGGSKTFVVALFHFLSAKFWPGYTGLSFGATQEQGNRCYEHMIPWVYTHKKTADGDEMLVKRPEIASTTKGGSGGGGKTYWKSGSKVEVVPGTEKAVNGPHPNTAHADEVEQIDQATWDESRNMAVAGTAKDGRMIAAQDILTSTRKSKHGRVQKLMNAIKDAAKQGLKPAHKLYIWCFVETTQKQTNCRSAPQNAERLAVDDPTLCDCHTVLGDGTMEDGSPRTFDKVCAGRLWYSDGWRPLEEVQNTFQQNSKVVWNAQQECSEPDTEGNYIDWDERKHEVFGFRPHPEQGPIYMAVDWGGTNPHAVNWYQRLDYALAVRNMNGDRLVLPQDSYVCFDEIYVSEVATGDIARRVIKREQDYRAEFPGWVVKGRFADPQGKADRLEFRDQGLKTEWPVGTRDFGYMLTKVQTEHREGRLYADPQKCPNFVAEVGMWRENPRTGEQLDEFNHCMSNLRYCIANVDRLERKDAKRRLSAATSGARSVARRAANRRKRGPVGYDRRPNPLSEFA
jgi:hypothetical protein